MASRPSACDVTFRKTSDSRQIYGYCCPPHIIRTSYTRSYANRRFHALKTRLVEIPTAAMSQHVFAWGEHPAESLASDKINHWVPDEERTSCLTCSEIFTLFLRKHHCRKCGEIYCHKCSARRIPLPEISETSVPGNSRPACLCLLRSTRRCCALYNR